ncbi:MAG TPA: hypothetical protein PKB02_13500 [Anaerohalosphaeraceae bacterium]|nr:hypothetical protein [Anaerohalosphaeraceae bacterium]
MALSDKPSSVIPANTNRESFENSMLLFGSGPAKRTLVNMARIAITSEDYTKTPCVSPKTHSLCHPAFPLD